MKGLSAPPLCLFCRDFPRLDLAAFAYDVRKRPPAVHELEVLTVKRASDTFVNSLEKKMIMGLRDPNDVAAYDEALGKVTIGGPELLTGRIEICAYDPAWPGAFAREAERIRAVLGDRVVRLEHVGSTSVPGLSAKPVIDIVLEVPDSSDEPVYILDLEAAGFVLRIREPDWFEHRLLKDPDTDVNLLVFSAGCVETDRMVLFRDWLRSNDADRDLYAGVKGALAWRDWKYVQQYADAKTAVITDIMTRAHASQQRPAE
jgi:GrpB-like predicted nucleotidyltransferase (UPF0157 family)